MGSEASGLPVLGRSVAACLRGPVRLFALAAIVALIAVACSGDAAPADSTAAPEHTPVSTPTPAPTPVSAPIPTATPAPTPTAVITPTSTPAPTATSEPTATPAPPSAQEVLNAVTAAMSGVTTAHVESDITVQVGLGGTSLDFKVEMVGDLVVPDRSHLTMKMAASGLTVEFEIITIGADSYMKNPLTGEWEANVEMAVPIGTQSVSMGAFGTDFQPDVVDSFTLTGIEELGGERVYHLSGTVTGADLAELMDDQSASQGEANVQYWVGVDDYLVRKTEISFEDSGTDPLTNAAFKNQVNYVTTLSDYNSPVTIEKPEVVAAGAGGLFASDDHGDSHETATLIELGETIEGEIDSEYDFDVFRFQAEEGRSYRIEVAPGTLEDPFVSLYNAAGDEESWEESRDEDGATILWEALWSDDYYVLVESFGGTGTYTVRVVIE